MRPGSDQAIRVASKPLARPKPENLRPVAEAAVGSVRETLKEQGLPAGGNVTFVQARTAREIGRVAGCKAGPRQLGAGRHC